MCKMNIIVYLYFQLLLGYGRNNYIEAHYHSNPSAAENWQEEYFIWIIQIALWSFHVANITIVIFLLFFFSINFNYENRTAYMWICMFSLLFEYMYIWFTWKKTILYYI